MKKIKSAIFRLDPEKIGYPRRNVKNLSKRQGCKNDPIFGVDLPNFVVDELHILLIITDRLEEGLIHTIIDRDEVF